jgi:predicted alpha-1,2-mannosidase
VSIKELRMKSWPCGVVSFLSLLSVSVASNTGQAQNTAAKSPYASVDPIIGTAGGGNTFPGASLPFGMIQWSPDTGPEAWYDYGRKAIYGFSLTHISGAGCPVYGDLPVLPWTGDLTVSPHQNRALYTQPFDHSHESAHPGYYALTLANGIRVEMAVTERAGIAHFYFPAGMPARLLVNTGGSANSTVIDRKPNDPARANDGYLIRLAGNNSVEGEARSGNFCGSPTRYTLHFAAQFQQAFVRTEMWHDDTVDATAHEENAHHAGAWLDFGDQREVSMKVGISFVSNDSARASLNAEIPGWDFDAVHHAAESTWTELLNRVAVEGGTQDQRTIFYTGLYHMLLSPNLFSDRNGDYIGFDDKVHQTAPNPGGGRAQTAQYANFSDWDIYRDVIQLQALLDPERTSDMAQSLVNDAKQSGWLPRWPAANDVTYVMGGDSPAILLADAYAFGARGFDRKAALQSMLKAATQPGPGPHGESERPYLADEMKLGFVPVDKDSIDVSRTLEYASDDFAIAQFARATGDSADSGVFLKRAGNWQNLVDPETKWLRARNSDGTWLMGFDALHSLPKRSKAPLDTDQDGFEEGNSSQYSFMIPFDYARLIPAMGGSLVVVPRLDSFFSKLICWGEPCFNMANEPDFVVPYTYAYTDQPWKTDDVVTRIEQQTFSTKPDGVPGNDDLGATSGVYVWNALGLYPGVPGVGGFFVGTPMFPQAKIHFADGRTLAVQRDGQGVYVNAIALNGQPDNSYWLPLDEVPPQSTTTLRFTVQQSAPTSTILKSPPAFIPER